MNLLFIEDDPGITRIIRCGWPDKSDGLTFVPNYRQSLPIVRSAEIDRFDAVTIDLQLPDGSGLELLRSARERSAVPLIVLSGYGDAQSRAEAIELGADDYLMKPFLIRELRARIIRHVEVRQAVNAALPRPRWSIGAVLCDLERRTLSSNGTSIPLTAMEARILEHLYLNRNKDVSKSALSKSALFREFLARDKTLEVYISRIRKKLSSLDPQGDERIQTVRGTGYHLRHDEG